MADARSVARRDAGIDDRAPVRDHSTAEQGSKTAERGTEGQIRADDSRADVLYLQQAAHWKTKEGLDRVCVRAVERRAACRPLEP